MDHAAKKQYLQLVRDVEAILKRRDPMRFFGEDGAPPDEYEGEARAIAGRVHNCKTEDDCRAVVLDVFDKSFGVKNKSASVYAELAQEIFALK